MPQHGPPCDGFGGRHSCFIIQICLQNPELGRDKTAVVEDVFESGEIHNDFKKQALATKRPGVVILNCQVIR